MRTKPRRGRPFGLGAVRTGSAAAALVLVMAASWAVSEPVAVRPPQSPDTPGRIEGVVDVKLSPTRRRRALVQASSRRPPTFSGRNKTVVYLQQGPLGAFESNESRAILDQRNEMFSPYVLPVQVGTIVHFPNNDEVFHNVFSLSSTKRFDLGRYEQGASKSILFDKPGVVRLFCDIHSHMSAFIVVFSHRFFTTTDEAGQYSLEGVPEGRYTLVAWADGEIRASTSIDVVPGETARADFVVE